METKLKSLKVVELKEVLSNAQQTAPTKATKSDLIARIIASKEATDAYYAKYAPKDDLLAPPEELDWDEPSNGPDTTTAAVPEKQAAVAKPPIAKPANVKPISVPETPATHVAIPTPANAEPAPAVEPTISSSIIDAELEKRKIRAERFNIPLVEVKAPVIKTPAVKENKAAPVNARSKKMPSTEEQEKLQARSARFGVGQKRPAPVAEEVDAEEQVRRQKRAERFGTGVAAKAT